MSVTLEITFWTYLPGILGLLMLACAAAAGLGYSQAAQLLKSTPLSLAIGGAGFTVMPIASEIFREYETPLAFVVSFSPWLLVFMAIAIDKRAKGGPSQSQSLQQTLDSADPPAGADARSDSSAAEPRR